MRECSRKRPTTERITMLSLMPGSPGGSMQAPRTIRSILAPAWAVFNSAAMSSASVSALIFTTTRAV